MRVREWQNRYKKGVGGGHQRRWTRGGWWGCCVPFDCVIFFPIRGAIAGDGKGGRCELSEGNRGKWAEINKLSQRGKGDSRREKIIGCGYLHDKVK